MTDLIERCNKLYCELNLMECDDWSKAIESFARECERDGYRKGVEDAVKVFSEWYGLPRALMLEKIRALLSKGEG